MTLYRGTIQLWILLSLLGNLVNVNFEDLTSQLTFKKTMFHNTHAGLHKCLPVSRWSYGSSIYNYLWYIVLFVWRRYFQMTSFVFISVNKYVWSAQLVIISHFWTNTRRKTVSLFFFSKTVQCNTNAKKHQLKLRRTFSFITSHMVYWLSRCSLNTLHLSCNLVFAIIIYKQTYYTIILVQWLNQQPWPLSDCHTLMSDTRYRSVLYKYCPRYPDVPLIRYIYLVIWYLSPSRGKMLWTIEHESLNVDCILVYIVTF
jgi:hypothetical protein